MTDLKFAKALGFEDYHALLGSSEVVVMEGDVYWYITKLPDGRWASWDDAELDLVRVSYAETKIGALNNIYDGVVAAGYDCTGEPVVEKYRVSARRSGDGWIVEAYGHQYYATGTDEEDAIRQVLDGAGEHDPTCCRQ